MGETTLIQIRLPKDFNLKLNIWLAEVNSIRKDKINKADLLVELAQIGLQSEKL